MWGFCLTERSPVKYSLCCWRVVFSVGRDRKLPRFFKSIVFLVFLMQEEIILVEIHMPDLTLFCTEMVKF